MEKVFDQMISSRYRRRAGVSTVGFAFIVSLILSAAGMFMYQINNQRTIAVYSSLNKMHFTKEAENDARERAANYYAAYKDPSLDAAGKSAVMLNFGCTRYPNTPLAPITGVNAKGNSVKFSCRGVTAIEGAADSYVISAERTEHSKQYVGRVILSFD